MREVKRYSESFKLQVISDLESGRFITHQSAMDHYGITGYGTVKSWLTKYGKNHLIPKNVRVETMDEKDKIKEMQKRIKILEKALSDTRVDQILAESYFESFCEEYGVKDIEGLKKKLDTRRFKKQ